MVEYAVLQTPSATRVSEGEERWTEGHQSGCTEGLNEFET